MVGPELEAPFWGFMGAAFALVFSNLGAAYGTGKSGIGISTLGVGQPDLIMKSIVPARLALRTTHPALRGSGVPDPPLGATLHTLPGPGCRLSWRVCWASTG